MHSMVDVAPLCKVSNLDIPSARMSRMCKINSCYYVGGKVQKFVRPQDKIKKDKRTFRVLGFTRFESGQTM